VPGVVSQGTFELQRAGEYALPCHEFCGAGHYAMRAHLVAVPRAQFPALSAAERAGCATP
jgi:cytochrome c oxidase subunit 2